MMPAARPEGAGGLRKVARGAQVINLMSLAEYRFSVTSFPPVAAREPILGERPGRRYRRVPPVSGAMAAAAPLTASIWPALSSAAYVLVKRVMDVVLAGALLLLLLPLFALIALAIWAEDRNPILFWQLRTGKDGKPFRFFKFRSMVRDAEAHRANLSARNEATGPIFKMRHDPRVTRVGKWLRRYSLDELPQLVHVLCGQMSLVGPRPLPVAEADCCADRRRRHAVQPGLICFREVGGRSHLTFEHWMELDLLYIERRSLATDLRILCRAVPAVLGGEGAY